MADAGETRRPSAGAAKDQLVRIGGRRLRITNLDKVLYPETGTTKGEVIDYYTRIAPTLIPHVTGRPVTRKRWPEGVGTAEHPEPSFFAKDLERGRPGLGAAAADPALQRGRRTTRSSAMCRRSSTSPRWRASSCTCRSGGSRPTASAGNPDRIVLDLDPGPGRRARRVRRGRAVVARDPAGQWGSSRCPSRAAARASTSTRALPGEQTSEARSRRSPSELARAIEADHPDLVVSSMAKAIAARPRLHRLEPEQRGQDHDRPVLAARPRRTRPSRRRARGTSSTTPTCATWLFEEVLERAETIGDPLAALGFHAGGRESDDGPLARTSPSGPRARRPNLCRRNALRRDHGRRASCPASSSRSTTPRALHWDFRLERDGVLVSWAVPTRRAASLQAQQPRRHDRGPPDGLRAPSRARSPRASTAAARVTIWDDGRYELEKWRDDEVILTVEGRPGGPLGRVRLALIRTDGRARSRRWLLHRMKTDAEGRPQPDGVPVETSEQADETTDAAPRRRARDRTPRPAAADDADGPGAAEGGPAPRRRRRDRSPVGPAPTCRSLAADRRRPAADAVHARHAGARQAAARRGAPRRGSESSGTASARSASGTARRLRLWARSGNDITAKYPELTALRTLGLGDEPAVVDGELVALDERGRPSFPLLQTRMNLCEAARDRARVDAHAGAVLPLRRARARRRRRHARCRCAERRELLEDSRPARATPIVAAARLRRRRRGARRQRAVRARGDRGEGPGVDLPPRRPLESWLKVKLTRTQEVVIGGIRPGQGRAHAAPIGSLLLGIPGPDGLQYAGRVGSGFSDSTLRAARGACSRRCARREPVRRRPAARRSDALWVRPELVGEVEFAEFTPGRHPAAFALARPAARQVARRGRARVLSARSAARRGVQRLGAVVLDVPGRLELERRVLHVEVVGQAPLQLAEHRARPVRR